jgi:hypothetical protein
MSRESRRRFLTLASLFVSERKQADEWMCSQFASAQKTVACHAMLNIAALEYLMQSGNTARMVII